MVLELAVSQLMYLGAELFGGASFCCFGWRWLRELALGTRGRRENVRGLWRGARIEKRARESKAGAKIQRGRES